MEYDKNPQLKFSRTEYKYLISFGLAEELKEYFSRYTVLDSANLGGKPYVIRSIYFDSPSLTAYKEKLNGDHERLKVRVRSYSDIKEKKVFLELKKSKVVEHTKRGCQFLMIIMSD
jgi:SPX domain protein involved in polyphosphate accumulation